jgi:hypothetical protein
MISSIVLSFSFTLLHLFVLNFLVCFLSKQRKGEAKARTHQGIRGQLQSSTLRFSVLHSHSILLERIESFIY